MAVNEDLSKERRCRTFNPDDLTSVLYGKDGMYKRRLACKRAAEDPELKIAEKFPTMNRDEVFDESTRMYMVMRQRYIEYGYDNPNCEQAAKDRQFYEDTAFCDNSHPLLVHHIAFIPSITGQGTPEQIAEFLPKAERLEIIGTYCQTELAHGSFVRGLETTATYDKSSQEFVLHSPRLSSIKYWPGGLGRSCNYVVLMAQLVIDGREYGIHPFMCQIRDLATHEPLPGVELGDINAKFGSNVIDNGYMKLTRHRIPRMHMLMKYSQVSPEGKYTRQNVPPQMAYLSMTYIRMTIVSNCAKMLAKAATIATRYAAVRRQTANSKGVEPQILDYQTQQMKLFPAISAAYSLMFTGHALEGVYNEILAAVGQGDISRMAELHIMTSGLKAFSSDVSNALIETCRRSCGGHGYSHASGIPKIFEINVVNCTVEGENTVLYLQCARSLMKFLRQVQSGEAVPAMVRFLADSTSTPLELKSAKVFTFELYQLAFKLNTLCMVRDMAARLRESALNGSMDAEAAWTAHSVGLVEAAKAFSQYVTVVLFMEDIAKREWEPETKKVMVQVCEFYTVHNIMENSGSFLQNNVLTPGQIGQLQLRRVQLLAELRPNAVTLVDAFDYPDRLLNSCLGRYDGNVYEALYEYAKSSSLNKHQVHPSYHKYVKPMQNALKARL